MEAKALGRGHSGLRMPYMALLREMVQHLAVEGHGALRAAKPSVKECETGAATCRHHGDPDLPGMGEVGDVVSLASKSSFASSCEQLERHPCPYMFLMFLQSLCSLQPQALVAPNLNPKVTKLTHASRPTKLGSASMQPQPRFHQELGDLKYFF